MPTAQAQLLMARLRLPMGQPRPRSLRRQSNHQLPVGAIFPVSHTDEAAAQPRTDVAVVEAEAAGLLWLQQRLPQRRLKVTHYARLDREV
jgi:hypothetical protein